MDESSTVVRELSVDEAVSLAMDCQQRGALVEAEDLYRRIFAVAPEHPRALHYAGVLAQQQGRSDQAVKLLQQSVAIEPQHADWWSNLGIVLQDRGQVEMAFAAYRRAIVLDDQHAGAQGNLGVLLKARGDFTGAEQAYRTAIAIDPLHADAHVNLGILLGALGRIEEALSCYRTALAVQPRHNEARRHLASACSLTGRLDEAVALVNQWVEEQPDDPIARHLLAAYSGRDVPARADDAFVERVFDNFAARFETKLANLSYRAPALVAAAVEELAGAPARTLDVLDIGCGTGLCGPLLAPYARRLVGVDLSARMLAQARQKDVYSELHKAEITAFLRDLREPFDVIVSADTLVYFGPLEEVAALAASALKPGGALVFTVEEWVGAASGDEYRLRPHGRYEHASAYVERCLVEAGLRPAITRDDLRKELGTLVPGLVVSGSRPGAAGTIDCTGAARPEGDTHA